MLMVFGVKSQDDAGDSNSITGNLDARKMKRNAVTQFSVKIADKMSSMVNNFGRAFEKKEEK